MIYLTDEIVHVFHYIKVRTKCKSLDFYMTVDYYPAIIVKFFMCD